LAERPAFSDLSSFGRTMTEPLFPQRKDATLPFAIGGLYVLSFFYGGPFSLFPSFFFFSLVQYDPFPGKSPVLVLFPCPTIFFDPILGAYRPFSFATGRVLSLECWLGSLPPFLIALGVGLKGGRRP